MQGLAEKDPGMTEAEFEFWHHGDSSSEFTGEGYWILAERDSQCVDCSDWASLCRENGAYIGCTPKASISMLADAITCRSCRQQSSKKLCILPAVNCSESASDDLEQQSASSPSGMETRLALGPQSLESSFSAIGVATSGTRQASVRTEELEEMGIDAATHDLVELAPQTMGSGHGASPEKSLQKQVEELDDDQHDQMPSTSGVP